LNGSPEVLLLLADGRWPGGGYAHSGALEAAVAVGAVHDTTSLSAFVEGRLHAAGPFEAWIASQACAGVDPVILNSHYDARTPSPAQRKASISLGRGMLRSSAKVWPEIRARTNCHQAVAIGLVARTAGLEPNGAARIALHSLIMSPLTAAPKLFSIYTADALRIAVGLASTVDSICENLSMQTAPPPRSSFFAEQLAEEHANWTTRLFAS
jgi:urease accessory protein